MIVIPNKKFIFLRVPRTASTSMSQFLLENIGRMDSIVHTPVYYSNFFGPNPIFKPELVHATINELIQEGVVDLDRAKTSRIFASIREPVDRFISYAYHINIDNTERDINKLVDKTLKSILPKKQSEWLMFDNKHISDINCYTQLSEMAQNIFKYLNVKSGGNIYYSHRSEERENKSCIIDSQLRKQILEIYKEDQILYEEALKKNG